MKFKLVENLSPSLSTQFTAAGHDAHSVVQQSLGGQPDDRVIEVCRHEGRILDFMGIIVFRLADQAHATVESAIGRVIDLLPQEPVERTLWIVEERRIRIRT